MNEDLKTQLKFMSLEQIRSRIHDLRDRQAETARRLGEIETELQAYEFENRTRAPRGWYTHQMPDQTVVQCEAEVEDTDGDALYIVYYLPKRYHKRPGNEDGRLIWLRTPEELARFNYKK